MSKSEQFKELEKQMKSLQDDITHWQRVRQQSPTHAEFAADIIKQKKRELGEVLDMMMGGD